MVARRTVLAALLGAAGCAAAPVVPPAPSAAPEPVTIERRASAARRRDVDVVTVRPAGQGGDLPVCLLLHGRGSTAHSMVGLGIPQFLTSAVAAGVPPFAAVAVDCGAGYFTAHPDDDALRMLTDELPGWIGRAPFAALGISMGGFGALRLARVRGDLRAVALLSPAMFLSWPDARSRNAFADEAEWAADEPLRHLPDVAGTPMGLWIGQGDPFLAAARRLIAGVRPDPAVVGPGGHDDAFWRRVLPDALAFVGRHAA
ncbi:alpha/beta hydrolase [Pseudonocardia sp. CA-107938]|uniref:alpha/beta hydrolase n=1 Tax=Pseudonocardia sp. CA-107938 TaxID=3240021 RepID=UPI003D8EBAAB